MKDEYLVYDKSTMFAKIRLELEDVEVHGYASMAHMITAMNLLSSLKEAVEKDEKSHKETLGKAIARLEEISGGRDHGIDFNNT